MSEKTAADKMFLKNAKSIAVLNGAAHPGVVSQLPAALIDTGSGPADVVLMFALNQKELEHYLPLAQERLGEKGSLWIGYLKQTASKATDINRDTINAHAKDRGITAVAIISLDGDWSALRLKRM
ncbi:MAG: hypothetical protein JWR40_4864 [Massilia sp.]|jgi:hypothetical protein|nr:hypothetical protein [Massilia sp.]MDB5951679.1 hypothetical protein [Massilia sp.]